MKKVLFFTCVIVSLAVNLYSQPAQDPVISPSTIIAPSSYHLGLLQPDKNTQMLPTVFLASVNTKTIATADMASNSPANKIGLGALNAATSWAEIPKQINAVSQKHNPLVGATVGLGEGIVTGLVRGASGVVDMATFTLPPYDKPLIEPAYQVKKPDQGFKVSLLSW